MTIQTAITNLYKAMTDNNKSALESLLSDKLTYGHSAGLLDTKQSLVDDVTSNKSRFTKVALSADEIIMHGDDIAVARHRLQGDFVTNNVAGGVADLGVMQVWQKQNGQWILIARQAFKWVG
jgi:hypothetical protein